MTPDERIVELEGLVRQQRQHLEAVLAQNAALQAAGTGTRSAAGQRQPQQRQIALERWAVA